MGESCSAEFQEVKNMTTYAEAGHQQVWHIVKGTWTGPDEYPLLADSPNASLCGMKVSRRVGRKRPPGPRTAICPACTSAQSQPGPSPVTAEQLTLPSSQPGPSPVTAEQLTLPSLLEEPYERRVISLGDTFVDSSCQRDEQDEWSTAIGDNFHADDFADDDPRVADRHSCEGGTGPNGERYAILDHQHQVSGAKKAGYPPDTPMHVKAYTNMTLAEQAEKFRRVNNQRHAVKALDDFKVALTAGEPSALRIMAELDNYSLTYGSAGVDGRIAAVGRLRKADKLKVLGVLLQVCTGAWGIRYEAFHAKVLDGLMLVLSKPRSSEKSCDIDYRHMAARLKRITPEQVIGAANHKDAAGLTAGARAANFIVDQYNTGLRTTPRLDYYR